MLSRMSRVVRVVTGEFLKHDRALENDLTISKIELEILIGLRTGDPVKVRYRTSSETDLTKEKDG